MKNEINTNDYKELAAKGQKLLIQDNFKEAIEYYARAIPLCENTMGTSHEDTANVYNKMGVAYLHYGKYDVSIMWLNKALKVYENINAENSLGAAKSHSNLGVVYSNLGKFDDSVYHHNIARQIKESLFGEKHKDTVLTYLNLGAVYLNMEDYDASLNWSYKSYNFLKKKIFDPNKYALMNVLNNIALAYNKKGDKDLALKWYFKSMKIAEKSIKTTKSFLVTLYNNISLIYRSKKDFSSALRYQKLALNYAKQVYPEYHPQLANIYSAMSAVYTAQKNHNLSLKYSFKSLNVLKKSFGDNHPRTAIAYSNVGHDYVKLEDYYKAMEYFKLSLACYKNLQGQQSIDYIKTYEEIAKIYYMAKHYQCSATLYEDIIALRESFNDNKKINIGNLSYNIARNYEELQKDDSIVWYERCIQIYKEELGQTHPQTIDAMKYLAGTCYKLKHYDLSIQRYSEIISILMSVEKIDLRLLQQMYFYKIEVYKIMNKYDMAIKTNLDAIEYLTTLGADKETIIVTTYNLAFNYSANEDFSNAIEYFNKSLDLLDEQSKNSKQKRPYIYAQIYHEMAQIYLGYYKDYTSSIAYFEKTIKVYKLHHSNNIDLARIYKSISYPYFKIMEYDKAADYCLKAKEILISQLDESNEEVVEIENIISIIKNHKYGLNNDNSTNEEISFLQ